MRCISAGLAGNALSIAVAFPKRTSRKLTSADSTLGIKIPRTMINAASPMALRMMVRAGGDELEQHRPVPSPLCVAVPPAESRSCGSRVRSIACADLPQEELVINAELPDYYLTLLLISVNYRTLTKRHY